MKKILALLLTLVLVIAMIPEVSAIASDLGTLNMDEKGDGEKGTNEEWMWYTNGVEVDDVVYTGNVLVLNGINYTTSSADVLVVPENTTIVLKKGTDNVLRGTSTNRRTNTKGINAEGDCTITGEGTLEIHCSGGSIAESRGIFSSGILNINGSNIEVYVTEAYDVSAIYADSDINLNSCEILADATSTSCYGQGIYSDGEMMIDDSVIIGKSAGDQSGIFACNEIKCVQNQKLVLKKGPDYTEDVFLDGGKSGIVDDKNDYVNDVKISTESTGSTGSTTYAVTYTVNKDGTKWNDHGKTYTYKNSGDESDFYTITSADSTITAKVPSGSWNIYDGDNIIKNVTVSSSDINENLNYYTISYNVEDDKEASGSTITATYDDKTLLSGSIVFGGSSLVITSTGAGAETYDYAWSGQGTNEQTTKSIQINSLSEKINATCTVTGSKTQNDNDKNKTDVSDNFSFTDGSSTYNGKEQTYEEAKISGFDSSEITYKYTAITGTLGTNNKPLGAGTYTVEASYSDDKNEGMASAKFTINKAVATISDVTYSIANKTYNKMQQSLSVTQKSGVGAVTVKYNESEIAPTNAGTYAITIDIAEGVNYGKATNITLGNWTIEKAPLVVVAEAKSKVKGEKDPQFTYQITSGSLFAGDTLTGSLARIAGELEGNHPITLGTLNNQNYEINFMGNYMTIKSKESDQMPVLSSISGAVTVDNGDPSDVVVTIMQGNKVFGKSIGTNYSFNNLIAGVYNITAKNDSGTKTVYKEIGIGDAITVDMNIGMKSTEIEVKGEDIPPIVMSVSALEDMLEEDPSINSLKLMVETKSVPEEIKKVAVGQTLVLNLDFKVIKNDQELSTYEFNKIITGTFPIPESVSGKEITIFRLHNGITSTMPVKPNADGEYVEIGKDTITLHVKKFSDYAVGYKTSTTNTTTNNKYEVVNAKTPQITVQPIDSSIKVGETKKLVVEALSPDGGVISYQWYSNTSALTIGGTLIPDATSSSYNVSTNKAGIYYYYVVVTNNNLYLSGSKTAEAVSNVVTVVVADKTPKTFKITYNVNGTKNVSKMPSDHTNYVDGTMVKVKGTPICTSRFFVGWNTKADGTGTAYEVGKSIKVSKNITLYAQWKDTFKSSSKLVYKVTGTNAVTCIGTTDSKKTSITIPDSITYKGITYNVVSVMNKAFYGNKTITSVKIGNNVKTIGNHAFYECINLGKVTIGTGLVTIGNHVFCHVKDGCIITINSTKLKSVKSVINHSVKKMAVKVPKSKLEAYKKLFATLSKSVSVKQ